MADVVGEKVASADGISRKSGWRASCIDDTTASQQYQQLRVVLDSSVHHGVRVSRPL